MTRLRLLVLAACGLALAGCPDVDERPGSASGPDRTARAAEVHEHTLAVTIDGRSLRASGRPLGRAVDDGRREIRVVVGGAAAWASGAQSAEQMTVRLAANDVLLGSYALTRTESEVVPADHRLAWARLVVDGGDPVGELTPRRGELVVDELHGAMTGGRYRLLRVSGTFRGTFVDESGLDHEVEGRFRYFD